MRLDLAAYLILGGLGLAHATSDVEWIYRGFSIPRWASWGVTIACAVGCFLCMYDSWKKKKTPEKPSLPLDEQYAQAKAELDRMYFREHGKMPEWPEAEANEEKEK